MIGNWLRAALFCFPLAFSAAADGETLALVGGRVYASPDAAPLPDTVVIATDGVITAIGSRSEVQIPQGAQVIDCIGKTIVAGFWNSHVHFTEAAWRDTASAPAAVLEAPMREMLTKWGFTTVWDLGSNPGTSLPLRARINAGNVAGPTILLAGNMYPKGGHPAYVPREVPLIELATPDEAATSARSFLDMGHDGIKLFTGAFMGDKPVVNMDPAVAKAAVDVAHARGKPVFAHPQNTAGVESVIAAGVDVMAHTVPNQRGGYTPEQLARFKSQGIALTPTLSLFTTVVLDPVVTARIVAATVDQLRQFSENGGVVLFGTDVGFIKIYDTTLEYELMHRALSEKEVLATLTTNPATYFKAAKKGKVEKGFDADFAILDGDPLADVGNLAKVAYTIRAGQVIYRKP